LIRELGCTLADVRDRDLDRIRICHTSASRQAESIVNAPSSSIALQPVVMMSNTITRLLIVFAIWVE